MPAGPRKQIDLLNTYQNLLSKFMIRATFSPAMLIYFFPVFLFSTCHPCAALDSKGTYIHILPKKDNLCSSTPQFAPAIAF